MPVKATAMIKASRGRRPFAPMRPPTNVESAKRAAARRGEVEWAGFLAARDAVMMRQVQTSSELKSGVRSHLTTGRYAQSHT
jgi:hypothetical protein